MGLATDEHLSGVAFAGVVVAIGAAGLIASERSESGAAGALRPLAYTAGAGTLFGWSLVLYSETSHDSGAWPALAGRVVSVALVVGVVVVARSWPPRLPPVERRMALGAGLLDVTATAMLLLAVREGLVAEVAPVAALGPAFTVVWAWIVLREPIGRIQVVGLVAALAGLVMITVG